MQSAFVSAYFKIVEQSENNFDTIFSLAAQPHFDRHDSTVSLSTKSQSYFKSKCLNKPRVTEGIISEIVSKLRSKMCKNDTLG